MKKIKMKQTIAMLLIAVMSLGLFAGCGNQKATEDKEDDKNVSSEVESEDVEETPTDEESSNWEEVSALVDIPEVIKKDSEHLSWMDTTSPVTLSVFYARRVGDFPGWDTPVEQKITELTGVTVDGDYSNDQENNELTLMIASGDPLPDIISGISVASTQYQDLVDSDSLYDLRELIEEYCPEMWEDMEAYPRDAAVDEDGHLYYLPMQASTETKAPYLISNGWFSVRGDVCEYFGIDPMSIDTLEDMENLLALYEENKDLWPEIKYPIYLPAMNSNSTRADGRPFYNSYGGKLNFFNDTGKIDMIYDKEADSVHYWLEDEYGYQALKYMWSLAQKGYVTEASFGMGAIFDEMKAGSVLISCGTNQWIAASANPVLAESVEGAYYQRIGMVSAEEGQEVGMAYEVNSKGIGQGVVITKDCKDPERAIKFLQFLNSEYGNLLVTLGIYGEDWAEETTEDGKLVAKFIGEAETAEGRSARGIYNYEPDWHNTNGAYDSFYSYSIGEEVMQDIVEEFYIIDPYEAAPYSVMAQEPTDSEYSLLKTRLEEIMLNYQTQMILAKDEAAFESLYTECLEVLEQNELDKLKEYVLGLTKDYIETSGVKFQ